MAVASIRKAQGLNRGSGEVFPRKRSYHPGRQAVFHQVSPNRGGVVDRQACATGSFQVNAGQGGRPGHPGQGPSADSTPAVFRARSGRGGEVDRQACAADSFQVMAIRGVFPRKRLYQSGRQSVYLVSPSCSGEVDRQIHTAGGFRAGGSRWQARNQG